jgi:hypothetical protein
VAVIFLAYSYVITYRAKWRQRERWWPPNRHEVGLWATTVLVVAIASIPYLNLVGSS